MRGRLTQNHTERRCLRPIGAELYAAALLLETPETFDDTVRVALLAVLERLTPAERTAFVLHDVFQLPFEAIATIVATWIRVLLPNFRGAIQPVTFAAPTAGNCEFVTYYNELFPTARRFQNSLDVIPHAYYDLGGINSIYASYMLDTPDIIWLGVLGMEAALEIMEASYLQPSQGQQILPGVFFLNDATDWYAQALHQHHLATYLGLLTGTQVDTATLPQPSVTHAAKARLVKRIGSLETALQRLADR